MLFAVCKEHEDVLIAESQKVGHGNYLVCLGYVVDPARDLLAHFEQVTAASVVLVEKSLHLLAAVGGNFAYGGNDFCIRPRFFSRCFTFYLTLLSRSGLFCLGIG